MSTYDWLSDIPESLQSSDLVEVQFKNTRKGYYLNSAKIELFKGDLVAVESSTGHDIGEVTLTGKLAELAMKNHRYRPEKGELMRVYRVARPSDLEAWREAKLREEPTMIQARDEADRCSPRGGTHRRYRPVRSTALLLLVDDHLLLSEYWCGTCTGYHDEPSEADGPVW